MVGPSGSGKSTLLNLLGCLDTPSDGDYILGGEAVAGLDKDRLATSETDVSALSSRTSTSCHS